MALRRFRDVTYLPVLSLRPAEMRALEELPNRTKDQLLPIIHLRPWVGSHALENSITRISDAYGERPVVVAMGDPELANDRPVYEQLDLLRTHEDGFQAWCGFVADHANYIPSIQFGPAVEEEAQITCLHQLGRGLFVIIDRSIFPAISTVADRVGQLTNGGRSVCFVLDFGAVGRDHLLVAAQTTTYIRRLREGAPRAYVSLSASSFPDSFVDLATQSIYERRLYEAIKGQPGMDRLIYGDRGSARAERVTGGGGQPAPRIDYPLRTDWNFYRSDDEVGFAGYRQQARLLMRLPVWNSALRVWGTQMIERTAAGDTSAISGPQKATAARINLHLQRQTFFDDPDGAEDTDEEWNG